MRIFREKREYFVDDKYESSDLRFHDEYDAVEICSIGGYGMQILHAPDSNDFHINIIGRKQRSFMCADSELEALCEWLKERGIGNG